ncbi:integrase [Pseudomonas viridiflava]|uniref:integrase n=1 Tax=Pseudomonas viridiflava TaxID=33069 RepID=UPI000F0153AB|nr:integrase [Pseudomonas viridiflava]TRN90391.1 integrase [Pseudomonas syringae]
MTAHLKLVSFNPNPELSPRSNLKKFIAYCRDELTLWADTSASHTSNSNSNSNTLFCWESSTWPDGQSARRLRFTNQANTGLHWSVEPAPDQLIHPAMIDVVKAYLRYRHTLKPHGNAGRELQAFRALTQALVEDMQTPDITQLRERHFQRAGELLDDYSARQSIIVSMLQALELLSEMLIVPAEVVHWQNPFLGARSYTNLKGSNAPAAVKLAKAADQDAFFSIADVFSRPVSQLDDSDIMVTSVTALLLSAPMRIGETLHWRKDCLRTDKDKNGVDQRYLAYYAPKTKSYVRKAVPTTMGEVAQEAVDRLVEITEEGRRLACYMESNPTKFYRHANCPAVSDDQVMTPKQVSEALGFANTRASEEFLKKYTGNYSLKGFTLDSLWQIVLAEHRKQNPHFPYQEKPTNGLKPLKMSESLMCFQRMQFGVRAGKSPVLLAPFNPDHYRKRLDGAVKPDRKNTRPMCFFTKHGFDSARLNPHSLRHFVNRLAKQGGMSIEAITEWSTRASIQQSRTYLHETPEQIRDRAATLHGHKQQQQHLAPVTEEKAESYGMGPYHRSRYGICRRSWRAGPCIKFADCTNCSELLACKGDKIALEAIKGDLKHMSRTREAAQRAVAAGERSGGLWLAKAEPQIIRLVELVNIMENPDIPDGSPIQMLGTDFSHESVLIAEKAQEAGVQLLDKEQLAIEYGQDLMDCLAMLASEI